MKLHSFQYLCGLTVLVSHIAAVSVLGLTYRFSELTDQVGSILILIPITLMYVTPFVKYVAQNATPDPDRATKMLDLMAVITMYIVVLAFCVSLLYVVVVFAFFSKFKINEFKMWLGAVESAFGALIGLVVERLFGLNPTATSPAMNTILPDQPSDR